MSLVCDEFASGVRTSAQMEGNAVRASADMRMFFSYVHVRPNTQSVRQQRVRVRVMRLNKINDIRLQHNMHSIRQLSTPKPPRTFIACNNTRWQKQSGCNTVRALYVCCVFAPQQSLSAGSTRNNTTSTVSQKSAVPRLRRTIHRAKRLIKDYVFPFPARVRSMTFARVH